jgi:hypothetical protein
MTYLDLIRQIPASDGTAAPVSPSVYGGGVQPARKRVLYLTDYGVFDEIDEITPPSSPFGYPSRTEAILEDRARDPPPTGYLVIPDHDLPNLYLAIVYEDDTLILVNVAIYDGAI